MFLILTNVRIVKCQTLVLKKVSLIKTASQLLLMCAHNGVRMYVSGLQVVPVHGPSGLIEA